MVNVEEVKRLLAAYGIPVTHVIDFKGPFEKQARGASGRGSVAATPVSPSSPPPQVRLYNDHGILLGVHGAGFINCAFMRQGSAVVEVFPYHVKHTLYSREASIAGLTHFPVYATDPTLTFKVCACGVW